MIFMLSSKLKVSPASSRVRIFSRVSCNLAAIIAEKKVFDANPLKTILQKKFDNALQTRNLIQMYRDFMLTPNYPKYSF